MKPILKLLSGLLFIGLLFTSCAKDDLRPIDEESEYTLRTAQTSQNQTGTENDEAPYGTEEITSGNLGIDPDKDEEDDDDDDYITLKGKQQQVKTAPIDFNK